MQYIHRYSAIIWLLTITTTPCATNTSSIDAIFQDIATRIAARRSDDVPRWDEYQNFDQFLHSEEAQQCIQQVYTLSPSEKVELFQKIGRIRGGDHTWIEKRKYLAILIKTGTPIDTRSGLLSDDNLLSESVVHDDIGCIKFAIDHKESAAGYPDEYPPYEILNRIKSAAAGALLLQNFPRFKNPPHDIQLTALNKALQYHKEPGVLQCFKDYGYPFNLIDGYNYTLLHQLAMWCNFYHDDSTSCEVKLMTLQQAGLDPLARNSRGQTALDMINHKLEIHPTTPALLAMQRYLQQWQST